MGVHHGEGDAALAVMPDNCYERNEISHRINVEVVLFAFTVNFCCAGITKDMVSMLRNESKTILNMLCKLAKMKKLIQCKT